MSRPHLSLPMLVLTLTFFVCPVARPDSVTLEPDADNSLYETPTGDLSNGSGAHLFAGPTFQLTDFDMRRALLHFDVAANIPAGSIVTSVTLTLNVSKTISSFNDVALHSVDQAWGEGSSNAGGPEGQGALAQPNDATWTDTFFGSGPLWNTPGGDFAAAPSAVQSVGFNGPYTWGSTPEMVADVQSWLDDSPNNFGWIAIGNEALQGTAKRFDSRENGNSSNRPKLVIEYCPPTVDASWANYGSGWPGTTGVPAFTASGDPILCAPLSLNIGNSSGSATQAYLLIGLVSAQISTGLGGDVLLIPTTILPFGLPGSGVTLPGDVPCDPILCDLSVFLQVLQSDAGASHGMAFTPGLELHFGTF